MSEERKELPKLQRSISESPKLRKVVAELRFLEAQSAFIFNSAVEDQEED